MSASNNELEVAIWGMLVTEGLIAPTWDAVLDEDGTDDEGFPPMMEVEFGDV